MRRRSPKSTFSSCRFFLFVAPLLPSSCLLFFPFSLFSLSLFLSSSSMNHVPDIRSSLSIRTVITVVVRWFQTIKYRIFSKLSSQFINKWFLKRKIELISREIRFRKSQTIRNCRKHAFLTVLRKVFPLFTKLYFLSSVAKLWQLKISSGSFH